MRKIRVTMEMEEVLNRIYDYYVLEDDNRLDKGAQELKRCYAYVLNNLERHHAIEFVGDEDEQD